MPEENSTPQALPEVNLAKMSAAEGAYEEQAPSIASPQETAVPSTQAAPVVPEAKPYNPMWDLFAKAVSTEDNPYKLPDPVLTRKMGEQELTAEQEFDLLVNSIKDHLYDPLENDPFVRNYVQAKNTEGFDRNKWLSEQAQSRNVLDLSNKDFMRKKMVKDMGISENNPDGLSEEQINNYLDKLEETGMLDVQAIQEKRLYRQELERADLIDREALTAAKQKELNTFKANTEKVVTNLIEKKKAQDEILGLKVSEAEKSEFNEFFKQIVMPSEKGRALDQILNDDNVLYDLLYPYWKNSKGMKDYTTSIKESVKQQMKEKLGLEPNISGQQATVAPKTGVNVDRLKAADGTY